MSSESLIFEQALQVVVLLKPV